MLTYSASPLKSSVLGVAIFIGTLSASSAIAQTKTATAQSIMANIIIPPTPAVDGTRHYDYDVPAAAALFTNLWDGKPPACKGKCGTAPPVPAPSNDELNDFVNSKGKFSKADIQCKLFEGGGLTGGTYTQNVEVGTSGNKATYTFTYEITPKSTTPVSELTAWVLNPNKTTVGTAVVTIGAEIAGQSVMSSKQHPLKFSFSLDNGVDPLTTPPSAISRITGLKYDVTEIIGTTVTPIAQDLPNHSLAFNSAASPVDFLYKANAGEFGTLSLLQNGDARSILNGLTTPADTFRGNDNGGTDGKALALATVRPLTLELPPSAGTYNVSLSGVVKGNSLETVEQLFNVAAALKVIGKGCGSL